MTDCVQDYLSDAKFDDLHDYAVEATFRHCSNDVNSMFFLSQMNQRCHRCALRVVDEMKQIRISIRLDLFDPEFGAFLLARSTTETFAFDQINAVNFSALRWCLKKLPKTTKVILFVKVEAFWKFSTSIMKQVDEIIRCCAFFDAIDLRVNLNEDYFARFFHHFKEQVIWLSGHVRPSFGCEKRASAVLYQFSNLQQNTCKFAMPRQFF